MTGNDPRPGEVAAQTQSVGGVLHGPGSGISVNGGLDYDEQ